MTALKYIKWCIRAAYAHMLRSCGGAKGVNKRVHSSIARDRCGPARVSRVGRVHVPRPDTWGAHGKLPGKSYDLSGTKIGKRAQCVRTGLRRQDPGGWIHVFSRSDIEIQPDFH